MDKRTEIRTKRFILSGLAAILIILIVAAAIYLNRSLQYEGRPINVVVQKEMMQLKQNAQNSNSILIYKVDDEGYAIPNQFEVNGHTFWLSDLKYEGINYCLYFRDKELVGYLDTQSTGYMASALKGDWDKNVFMRIRLLQEYCIQVEILMDEVGSLA